MVLTIQVVGKPRRFRARAGMGVVVGVALSYKMDRMAPDLLARFILGGLAILLAAEQLGIRNCSPARTFFLSPLWPTLRYSLIAATVVLCAVVLATDWS